MIKITALKRLAYAASTLGSSDSIMPDQVRSIRDRLNTGTDSNGQSFAPYATQRKTNHSRPLALASRLFDDVQYSTETTLSWRLVKATISGQAAKIAGYQNMKRDFMSFSQKDKDDIIKSTRESLREAMSQWR